MFNFTPQIHRCISLEPNFAEMVIKGSCKIVLKRWSTPYRGPVLIAAKKQYHVGGWGVHREGQIVGCAYLADCQLMVDPTPHEIRDTMMLPSIIKHHDYYGLFLVDPERFDRPIGVMGRAKVFEVELYFEGEYIQSRPHFRGPEDHLTRS